MKQYFKFEGRSTRSQYWGVQLLAYLLVFVGLAVGAVFASFEGVGALIGFSIMIASAVAHIWVYLATTYRRCVDAGISTYFTWLAVVPYINFIAFIVFGCIATDSNSTSVNS